MDATPEQIDRIVASYHEATERNRTSPQRRGSLVLLTPEVADEVMVAGDLHGHRQNFAALIAIADLEARPRRHLVLQEVCHGGETYSPTGGCMSHSMLEEVASLKARFPDQVHFILGNHELAELTDYPIQKNRRMLNVLFRLGLQHAFGRWADVVREASLPFLKSCPLGVRLSGGVFISHSVPENAASGTFDATIFEREITAAEVLEKGPLFNLVWGRDYSEENARAFARLVGAEVLINGHEPCPNGFGTPNSVQVILDCCSDRASYVILSTDRRWTQADVVARIRSLG